MGDPGDPKQGRTDETDLSKPLNHRNPAQSANHQRDVGENVPAEVVFRKLLGGHVSLSECVSI
jgi:hypothetical protein